MDDGRIDPILSLQRLEEYAIVNQVFQGPPTMLRGSTNPDMWTMLYNKLHRYFSYITVQCRIGRFGQIARPEPPGRGLAFGPQSPLLTFSEAIDFASGANPIDPTLSRNENGFTVTATLED